MKLPADLDSSISFLHGFLKALEIAAERRAGISVGIYKNKGSIEADLSLHLKKCEIEYSSIKLLISNRDDFIKKSWAHLDTFLNHLQPSTLEDLKLQFEECIGLISTSININEPFNPLYSTPIYEVALTGSNIQTLHIFKTGSWMLVFSSENSA